MNPTLFGAAAIALYLLTSVLLGVRFSQTGEAVTQRLRVGAISIGLGAVLLHAVALYQQVLTGEGLDLGFFNAVSLATLAIALVLLVSALSQPVENLGIVLLPIAALAILLRITNPGRQGMLIDASWQLQLHIVISILAYSLFAIAAVQALLLAAQERSLRNRRPGGYLRALPPLQTMESLMFQMIGVGFALLSAALLTGFLFLENMFAQHLVHKTVLSIIAWAVFGILLWGRARFGWRGRTATRWTLSGFGVLMVAYFGSKLVLELLLGRVS